MFNVALFRWYKLSRRSAYPSHGGRVLLSMAVAIPIVGCASLSPKPPVARVSPFTQVDHGAARTDDYHWLCERDNPDVIAYLEAENAYTDRTMRHTKRLQERLYAEMKGRIKETDLSVPVQRDDYFYYHRTIEGKQYPVYCRKRGSLDAAEEILLDVNRLAKGHEYCRIGVFVVSPDHKLLAYSVDTAGAEVFTVYIKDLETGGLLLDEIPNTYYSLEWANDNKTLFYTTLDEAKRPFKVYRHVLGTDPKNDRLVYHEEDERFFVGLDRTRSRRYLLLSLNSQVTSEVRFLDTDTPNADFAMIAPRRQGIEYSVEHHKEHFYITTNEDAVNFKVVKAPVSSPDPSHWEELIPHRAHVKIDGVDAFRDYLAVYLRDEGLRKLWIMDLRAGTGHDVDFPEPDYTYRAFDNEEFDTDVLRFNYTSLITPPSVYDYNMSTRTRVLKKRKEVLGGYEPSEYQSERVFATASDGTRVPISLVYRKGLRRNGRNPMLLAGYGSYGASYDPFFSSDILSLLDRGFVFGIAHVRGGGEMGRPWYEDGKLLAKRNTFTDFIACAEHMIREGYTRHDRLIITGGSAGGLLMGAVMTMRPDLLRAVVARVPFVDVVNTMLDESIPLTIIEYEEWGNPHDKTFFDYMLSYSPYDNIEARGYPAVLLTAGLNDPRVQYWEPAKFAAKLRAMKTDDHVLLLKTNMGAGHGGASGRYDALREKAFIYAFVLDAVGIRR